MKIQDNDWACGAYAIYNAMTVLGYRVSIKSLIKACGTDPKVGTNEAGIARGLKSLDIKPRFHVFETQTEFYRALRKGDFEVPAICCVDNDQHWVVLLGGLYDRFIVLDSSPTKENRKRLGFHSYSAKKWFKRWSFKRKLFAITFVSGDRK